MTPYMAAVAWDATCKGEPIPEILLKRKNHPKKKPQRRGGGGKKKGKRETSNE